MKNLFTVLILILTGHVFTLHAQTSWKGTVSTNWSTASNWTAGVPTSTVDAIIGDANFTGSFQPSLSGNGAECRALTIGSGTISSTLTITRNINCFGDVTIGTNGTVLQNSNNRVITVKGNWNNTGTYSATANGASVIFSGTAQTISGTTTFRAMTINTGSTVTLANNLSVSVAFTVNGTFDPTAANIISGAGNMIVNSGGALLVKAATFGGNYALTGTITLSGSSTVNYASAAINQNIDASLAYGYLRISGGMTKFLVANLPDLNSGSSSNGRIYVDAGTFDLQSYTANRGTSAGGGYIAIATGATLKIGGTNGFPSNYSSVAIASNSTVNYYGNNQTIANYTYGHLIFESSAGSVTKTMPSTPLTIAGNLTVLTGAGTGVTFSAGNNITVNLNVSLGASTTFNAGSYTHAFKSNWVNNGVFSGNTSSVLFYGNGATLSGTGTNDFYSVTFYGAAMTCPGTTAINVAGNLATSGAGLLTHNSGGTLTMTGASKTISGSGLRLNNLDIQGTITTSSGFVLSGNFTVSGSFTASAWSVVTMNGSSKTITATGSVTFYSLTVAGTITTASMFTMLRNFSVLPGGSFLATAGTITFDGSSSLAGTANFFNVIVNAGHSLALGTNSNMGIAGVFTNSGSLNVTSYVPNTVTYNSAGTQSITANSYNNLVLANGGTKTPVGNFSINRDLTINSGVTFNASTFTLSLYRNFTNNGSFTAGTSTIQFLGSQVATVSGATTFNNVTGNKSNATISIDLSDNITTNNLTMTNGNMQTGTHAVTITGTRSGNGIIIGAITHAHAFSNGVPYYFEGPQNFITFSSPSGSLTSVTVKAIQGPVANVDPAIESVEREFEILIPAGTYTSATLRYHYEDNELNAFSEPFLALYKYNSGVLWDSVGFTSRNTTSNYVEYAGLTNLPGRYTASGLRNVIRWNGSVSSAWETAANWTTISGSNMANRIPSSTDAAQFGQAAFTNQPVLSSNQTIGLIEFGSVQAVVVTISSGTLDNLGAIRGAWSASASHTFDAGSGTVNVGTYLSLSDGVAGHDITLQIGTGTVNVYGTLSQSATGTISFTGNGTLSASGIFSYAAGTFTAGTGTVVYTGSEAQVVAPVTYNNLSFTKTTSNATINSSLTVNGNLSTGTGGEIFANAGVTIGGNVTLGAGTNFTENGVLISCGGNWATTGLFTTNNGEVRFTGSGSQTVNATTFNSLTVNKTGGSLTLTGNLVINSDLTVSAGTLELSTFTADRSNSGGALTLSATGILKVGGSNNFPQSYLTDALDPASTVEYMGTIAQSVAEVTYGHLTFTNGAAAKSLVANVSVSGDLLINSGATLNPGAYTIILNGNFTNSGAYTPATSTLKLTGTSKTITGSSTLCNLLVTGSYVVTTGTTSMSGNFSILTGGSFSFGSNNASLDGDLTVSGSLTSNGTATFTGTRVQTLQLINAITSSSTGVINFNGTVAPVLNSNTPPTFATVNINNTAGITPSVPWTVYFNFSVGAGASFNGGALTHIFYGNFTNNGTVTSSGELKFTPMMPFSAGATIQLDGTSFVSTGKVTFGGSVPMTITNVNPTLTLVSITNTSAAGVTPPSAWIINGELFVGTGSVFHLGSALSHTLVSNITNNGTIDGQTSTITMTGSAVTISGLGTCNFAVLAIDGAADVTLNKNINISSNLIVDGLFTASGRTVTFNGTTPSVISGLAGSLTLDDMEQNKTGSTTSLSLPVLVTGTLTMTNGIILSTAANLITLTDDAISTEGNSTSYVDGPMKKIGDDAFVFPVGDGSYWARLAITAPAVATDAFTAQYFAVAYSNTTSMAASPAPALYNVSSIEYWTCDRNAGTASVSVGLYWESAGRSVINNYSPDLVVARWNGAAWENAGQSAIDPASPGNVTSNSVSSFSPFTFGSLSGSNPLPIELVSFTAELNEQHEVNIAWQTNVEINNDYFTVERTADGVTYETVSIVDGAGTSSQQHHYTAIDHSPLAGLSFYRLKQTDANGNFTYSQLRSVTNDADIVTATDVYPNPCDGSGVNVNVNATADESITITLLDASGKECYRESFVSGNDGENLLRLEFTTVLQPGIYFLYTELSGNTSGQAPAPQKVVVQ